MADLDEVLSTVELGPSDRLVIVMPGHATERDLDRWTARVRACGFGDRVLLVAGPVELAVLRGDRAEVPHD